MFTTRRIVQVLMVTGFILPFIIIYGCDDTTGPVSDIVFPDVNVSYSEHVQPLFNQTCALSGCHNDASQAGGLSLTSYGNLTLRPNIVVPFAPEESLLYLRIEGQLGEQMPLNRPPLNRNQRDGIRTWIEEGADNN